MTIATKRMTLDEYLAYDDGTDRPYELVAGELVEMPPESWDNSLIARFLLTHFLTFIPFQQICYKDTEIVVGGRQSTTRLPDLMIIPEELAVMMSGQRRSTITLDMPPPLLVMEVVSPGKTNEDRDYRYKRSEYAARGIAEYWIVDPLRSQVTLLTLVDGLYEEQVLRGSDRVLSPNFPDLALTVDQILAVGMPDPSASNPG